MNLIDIYIVEDEILIREGIKAILSQEKKYRVVKEFNNGNTFLEYILKAKTLPDIVLMDIRMPVLNGVEATKQVIEQFPDLKIIALSNYVSNIFVTNMLGVGAAGYLPKSVTPDQLFKTLNLVITNGFYYDNDILNLVYKKQKSSTSILFKEQLTPREIEVLKLICSQKSAVEIGELLHISPRTVDGHRNNLLLKTESKNLVGLVVFAMKNNLFLPEF